MTIPLSLGRPVKRPNRSASSSIASWEHSWPRKKQTPRRETESISSTQQNKSCPLTQDTEIANEIVLVRGVQQIRKLHLLAELATDGRGDLKVREVVERAGVLEGTGQKVLARLSRRARSVLASKTELQQLGCVHLGHGRGSDRCHFGNCVEWYVVRTVSEDQK